MTIKIKWLSDETDAIRGARRVQDSLEDVADGLHDVDDEAKDTERTLADTFRDVERDADQAGRKIGTELDDGFDKAKKGAQDFKQEANQTARESAASFDGSAESIGDAFQEVAANAFSGFGPAGAAAGIAAAAGLGFALSALEEQEAAAQRLKDFLSDAYRTAAEEGRKYLDVATIQAEAFDILFNSDRAEERNRAEEQAIQIGLDANTVILARAGDQESLNAVIAATAAAQDDLAARTEAAGSTAIRLSLDERNALTDIAREYEAVAVAHEDEAKRAGQAQEIKNQLHAGEREQIQRTRDADQARWEAFASAAATAKANASGEVVVPVRLQDNTNYGAFRASVYSRLGVFSAPVQLGPGIGSQWDG